MKPKLISFACILFLSASLVNAQSTKKEQASFAILGGLGLQNIVGKDNAGNKLTNGMIIGYHAGLNIQIPLAPEFYFQPGILFSTKGAKNDYGSLSGSYKLFYFEMPLNVVYKGILGNGYIMVGFGPSFAIALGGNSSIYNESITIEDDIIIKNVVVPGDDYLTVYARRFDSGGNIFAGYETAGGLFFQLDTQFGLLNINPEDQRLLAEFSELLSLKNMGFGLSLGYRF